MGRQAIQSSNLKSYSYDKDNQIFEVEFKSGGVYQYYGVPELLVRAFENSKSYGSFFHASIKGQYASKKL